MDWTNRENSQPAQPATPGAGAPAHRSKKSNSFSGLKLATVGLLFSAVLLVVAVIGFLMFGKNSGEAKYVDKDKMQAVFLNGGQVYFGRIKNLNSNYLRMTDIYYLRVNQQVQPNQEGAQQQAANNDISLVKLGCELHGPQDSMLINREQVVFWENLKDDGQVAKAVAEYIKANPNGQKCDEQATTPQSGTETNTNQNGTGTSTAPKTNTNGAGAGTNNTTNQ